jgi:type I restriction enzyme S subunit
MDATFHDTIASEDDRLIQRLAKNEALSDLVDINTTEKLKRVFVSQEYGVPLFTQTDIGRLRYSPTRFLSKHLLPQSESWAIHEGDLLLVQNSPLNASASLGTWADKRFQGSCPSTDIWRLRADDKKISSGYIYAYLFLTDVGYRQIVRTIVGSSKPHLSMRDILALRIPRTVNDIESEADLLVREAGDLRAEAQEKEDNAYKIVEQAL